MFSLFKSKKNAIDKLGLREWYNSVFSDSERELVERKCEVINTDTYNASAASFLLDCMSWFDTKENSAICLKFAQKSEELLSNDVQNVYSLHFIYMHLIKFYYKNRDIDGFLEKAVECCKKQIAIGKETSALFASESPYLPTHTGYEQLAIIEKKNKNWNRVIELCNQAKSEGWGGDWDKRIAEAEKNLAKNKN